jgi:DegV family protein with EDD domain
MSSHRIALITDSGCDLPDDLLKKHSIDFAPLHIFWGSEDLRDRVDIQPRTFYERIVSDPVHPSTSQPSPQEFVDRIQKAAHNGAHEAVIITISSGMSSTNNSALQAQRQADIPVHVFDSKANSMSQGWQVLAAARVRDAGGSAEDMLEAADRVRRKSVTLLYVDTLEYLHRGGRIGTAAKWLGTMLSLKPQLYVDHQTGKIEPGTRARTQSKALEQMYRSFFGQLDTSRPIRVGILHGNVPDLAKQWARRIQQEYAPVELLTGMTSPVMGVHTGPGAMALCGYSEA